MAGRARIHSRTVTRSFRMGSPCGMQGEQKTQKGLLTDRNTSRIEEPFDLSPKLPDNVICADVPILVNRLQCRVREFRELSGAFIGDVRIVDATDCRRCHSEA